MEEEAIDRFLLFDDLDMTVYLTCQDRKHHDTVCNHLQTISIAYEPRSHPGYGPILMVSVLY